MKTATRMTEAEATQKIAVLIVKILYNAGDRNDYEGFCAALEAASDLQNGQRSEALAHIKPFLFQYVEEAAR